MASKQTFDAIASRIRIGIDKLSSHSVSDVELEELWDQSQVLSPEEKTMLLNNFAITYGFQIQVNGNLTSARFYVSS